MATLSTELSSMHMRSSRWAWLRCWDTLAMIAIVLLAGFLNIYQLNRMGYANSYYAAAVQSMAQSWHAFFYGAIDSVGFITVDKPPVALWVQALSVRVFGFNSWSLLLPQALAGIASVLIVGHLVRRRWGRMAGMLAALGLAITPISVAINRTNNMDSLLVLVSLLATWSMIKATERGSLRWLLTSVALVGVGFNIKMLQAFLIAPALYALYLVGTKLNLKRKIVHLAIATVVLFAVSLSWATIVDLTPADQRPYIGGSSTNSVYNLLLDYNGIGRITGEENQPGGNAPNMDNRTDDGTRPNFGGAGAPNQAGGMFNSGTPGVTRLFSQVVGPQASWLVPLGVIGLVLGWRRIRVRRKGVALNRQGQDLVLWGTWLVTDFVVFSFASGIFHSYYLSSMAPAIAALFGIGAALLWRRYRRGGWRAWLLPLALLATAALQIYFVRGYAGWSAWLVPIIGVGTALAVLSLLIGRVRRSDLRRWGRIGLIMGVLSLAIAPTAWATTPVFGSGNATMPQATPELLTSNGNNRMMGFGNATMNQNSKLISFLEANRNGATYLLAAQSSMTSAPIIIASKQPVLTMGGFNGGDPAPTLEQLQTLIKNNDVRYVLTGGRGGPPSANSTSSINSWVTQTCTAVDTSLWQDTTSANSFQPPAGMGNPPAGMPNFGDGAPPDGGFGGNQALYDCSGK